MSSIYRPFGVDAKNFNEDIKVLLEMLKSDINFSFSKYADGEYAMLRNISITVQPCDNWSFRSELDKKYSDFLLESFKYFEPGYYVGISCPCCQPMPNVQWMRDTLGAPKEYVTWANIFVNGNYKFFMDNFIPEFKKKKVVIVASEKGNKEKLPFEVEEYIPIKQTAWRDNFDLVEKLSNTKHSGKLFLFCAGPLGNMLAYSMWKHNKNNTYMDIGSTLNPWIVGVNRDYMYENGHYYGRNCIW